MKSLLKDLCPPLIWRGLKAAFGPEEECSSPKEPEPPEYEYLPGGWEQAKNDPKIRGWNVEEILAAYLDKWPEFVESVKNKTLGLSPESHDGDRFDLSHHNIVMTFGYVLAKAGCKSESLSMLDWGGGLGHYYLLARALMPEVELDYHCRDLPILAKKGRELLPETSFYSDDNCLERKYDLIMASSSLQYSEDWREVLGRISDAAKWLYVTRIPTLRNEKSYVFVQRPYRYGYNTEYAGWAINRDELVELAAGKGFSLEQEFVFSHNISISRAREEPTLRGFLFRNRGE